MPWIPAAGRVLIDMTARYSSWIHEERRVDTPSLRAEFRDLYARYRKFKGEFPYAFKETPPRKGRGFYERRRPLKT